MSDHIAWDGTGMVERGHMTDERISAIRECDEAGISAECNACGERTLEKVYTCRAAGNKPVTAYCYTHGKRGCIWRMTQRCAKATPTHRCTRCGAEQ